MLTKPGGKKFLVPIILVTSLFFLWGFAYGLLDVLNKHFQETLNISREKSMLIQASYFGAYFLIAVPAGFFMQRNGYKKGILAGLLLYALGALLFYPSAQQSSYNFFLISLFILASGLTFLETAANPYITVLGEPTTSEFRLNLSQSFNGVGSFLGPMVGGALFFGQANANASYDMSSVKFVYVVVAAVVLLVAFLFYRTPMPDIREEELVTTKPVHSGGLLQHRHFIWAVVTQFFYVAAQVGIAALFINYCTEQKLQITNERASYLLGASLLLFTIGRFAGTALMKWVAPNRLLAVYALINILLSAVVVWWHGYVSIYALMAIFFFESIMFPTIFALGVKNLGSATRRGASVIIMSIVGGALVPVLMGSLADRYSTAFSYIVPLFCFVVVLIFAVSGYKLKYDLKTQLNTIA